MKKGLNYPMTFIMCLPARIIIQINQSYIGNIFDVFNLLNAFIAIKTCWTKKIQKQKY